MDAPETQPAAAALPDDLDEAELLARLQAGEPAAFELLVRRFAARMLAVARRLLPDENDAQDALQDAFISAFGAIDRFQAGSRLSTWLHRIVVNAALMKLRTRRRRPEVSIDALLPQFAEDGHPLQPASPWKPPEAVLSREELAGLVRSRIAELPENYRDVLLLRDIEGMDTGEAAHLLGISENAVKTRLHRARQALRALLDPQLRGESS